MRNYHRKSQGVIFMEIFLRSLDYTGELCKKCSRVIPEGKMKLLTSQFVATNDNYKTNILTYHEIKEKSVGGI